MSGVVTDLMRAERAEEQLARLAADLLTLCRAGDVVNGMVDTNAIRLLVKAVSNPYIVGRVHIGDVVNGMVDTNAIRRLLKKALDL
jgi:hypothetical protein